MTRSISPVFRYIRNIDQLSNEELEIHSYYRGSVCAHGHVIRDTSHHWCYHCAQKIMSNVCGFDINYLHRDYKIKYESLWKGIKTGDFDQCWENTLPKKRICFPSYRSGYSYQNAEQVGIPKLIYQCSWGDVGNLHLSKTCKNKKCLNPLHMTSAWNRAGAPKAIIPFVTTFQYEKLMLASRREINNLPLDEVLKHQYKMSVPQAKNMKYPKD